MQIKKERLESIILKEVSLIIQNEVRDPEIGFATITDVSLTNDYSYAKIYVTFLDKLDLSEKRLEAINRAKGLIRSKLAKKLSIKKTPELNFVLDKSLEQGNRIEEIINILNK